MEATQASEWPALDCVGTPERSVGSTPRLPRRCPVHHTGRSLLCRWEWREPKSVPSEAPLLPGSRRSSAWAVFLTFFSCRLMVIKWRRGECLEAQAPHSFCSWFFSSSSLSDFFESKEKGIFPHFSPGFALKGPPSWGHCWVLITAACFLSSSSWVGLGSLLPIQGRSPGDSEWNFFYREHAQHLTRCEGQSSA